VADIAFGISFFALILIQSMQLKISFPIRQNHIRFGAMSTPLGPVLLTKHLVAFGCFKTSVPEYNLHEAVPTPYKLRTSAGKSQVARNLGARNTGRAWAMESFWCNKAGRMQTEEAVSYRATELQSHGPKYFDIASKPVAKAGGKATLRNSIPIRLLFADIRGANGVVTATPTEIASSQAARNQLGSGILASSGASLDGSKN
jgi:hypothetical protein